MIQRDRDVTALPKAIIKCGLVMYKLPPLTAASCIIASGSFILDFNIQGLRYRHYDYVLVRLLGNRQTVTYAVIMLLSLKVSKSNIHISN